MRERTNDIVTRYSLVKAQERKEMILFRARREVEINGNGTTGYKIKHGPDKGKVLGHIRIEPKTI